MYCIVFQVSNWLPFLLCRRKQTSATKSNEICQGNVSGSDDDTLYRKPNYGGLVDAVAPVVVQSAGKIKKY